MRTKTLLHRPSGGSWAPARTYHSPLSGINTGGVGGGHPGIYFPILKHPLEIPNY